MEHLEGASTIERMLMKQAQQSGTPINGSIELLPLCNMNCDMCYVRLSREQMEQKGRLRTAAEWLALGKEMQRAGVLFLLLTGGEPLIYPDFREVYLGLRQMGMILTLNTNGTLLDEEWADFFAQNKPRRINITLYGADDAAYERLCHYPGGFEKTLNAIRLLRERNVDVRMGCSVTPENAAQLEKIQQIGKELDVSMLFDYYMLPAQREREMPFPMQSRLTPEEAAQTELRIRKSEMDKETFAHSAADAIIKSTYYSPTPALSGMSCLAGSCSFTVNWQGELRPCVIMSEPTVSVFDNGFEAAWKKIQKHCSCIRLNPECVSCKLRPLCRTCAASAKIETGEWDGVPEYLCRYSREYLRLLKEEVHVEVKEW